jgi:hypothetical protein
MSAQETNDVPIGEQIARALEAEAESERGHGTEHSWLRIGLRHAAQIARALTPASKMTHCANCGGRVPVDSPHQIGECTSPALETADMVPAARLAEVWDEGALWAAVECGAIDDEAHPWLAAGDNPYRATGSDQ